MINFYANRSFFCLSGAKARYPACDLILVVIWALPSEFYRPDSVFRIDFVIYSLKGVQKVNTWNTNMKKYAYWKLTIKQEQNQAVSDSNISASFCRKWILTAVLLASSQVSCSSKWLPIFELYKPIADASCSPWSCLRSKGEFTQILSMLGVNLLVASPQKSWEAINTFSEAIVLATEGAGMTFGYIFPNYAKL